MKKINSSAMYYALFLSVVFGLILGGFVLFSGFNQQFSAQMDVQELLIDNAHSGIAYGQVNFKELEVNKPIWLRLYNEGIDSVQLERKNWGAFTVIKSSAFHDKDSFTKLALLGESHSLERPNLYVPDYGRPLSLCGDARLEGDCRLPKSGLKRAYIEGKNYTGGRLFFGTKSNAEKQLPPVNSDFLSTVNSIQAIPRDEEIPDSVNASFAEEATKYISDGVISLTGQVINGQVILEAKDSLFIGADTQIHNAIVKSKVVHIQSGFSGTLQVFASEKITIEDHVQLLYPSVLGTIEKGFPNETSVKIAIGENSQVIGSIFLVSETPNFRLLPELTIAKEAEVDGFIYCQGKTDLRGTVNGHLFTQKFFLKTASSYYENHLMDGKVLDQLPKNFVSANLLEETQQLKRIEWLR